MYIMSCRAFIRITRGKHCLFYQTFCILLYSAPLPRCQPFALYFRYVRSLVSAQLGGKNKAPNTLGTCAPQQYVNDMENAVDPRNGEALSDNAAVDPCGLMPYSYFNDSYVMSQQQPGGALTVVDLDVSPSCSSSSACSLAVS